MEKNLSIIEIIYQAIDRDNIIKKANQKIENKINHNAQEKFFNIIEENSKIIKAWEAIEDNYNIKITDNTSVVVYSKFHKQIQAAITRA